MQIPRFIIRIGDTLMPKRAARREAEEAQVMARVRTIAETYGRIPVVTAPGNFRHTNGGFVPSLMDKPFGRKGLPDIPPVPPVQVAERSTFPHGYRFDAGTWVANRRPNADDFDTMA